MTETTLNLDSATPLVNLRDMGGLPVHDGALRAQLLWRADDVAKAPQTQLAELAGQGLGVIIDLRSASELEQSGRGASTALSLTHCHLPLTERVGTPAELAAIFGSIRTATDVGSWYAELFHTRRASLVAALEIIADSEQGVLFHCAAGKDRTGVLAATVLSVLGASDEVIIEDYAATAANLPAILDRLALRNTEGSQQQGASFDPQHPMLGALPDSMAQMLRQLRADGGVRSLLSNAGLQPVVVDKLRERLVEH